MHVACIIGINEHGINKHFIAVRIINTSAHISRHRILKHIFMFNNLLLNFLCCVLLIHYEFKLEIKHKINKILKKIFEKKETSTRTQSTSLLRLSALRTLSKSRKMSLQWAGIAARSHLWLVRCCELSRRPTLVRVVTAAQPWVATADCGRGGAAQPRVATADGGRRGAALPRVAMADGGRGGEAQPRVAMADGGRGGRNCSITGNDAFLCHKAIFLDQEDHINIAVIRTLKRRRYQHTSRQNYLLSWQHFGKTLHEKLVLTLILPHFTILNQITNKNTIPNMIR